MMYSRVKEEADSDTTYAKTAKDIIDQASGPVSFKSLDGESF